MGYVDPNSGTHFYASGDPLATTTIYSVLNEAQTAEHNARLADRARLDDLEEAQFIIHTIVPSSFVTLNSGWSFYAAKQQFVRRMGPRIEFSLHFTKSSAMVHGDFAAMVNTAWKPVTGSEWVLSAMQGGGGSLTSNAVGVLNVSRQIKVLTPTSGNTDLSVTGFYHLV